MKPLHLPSSLLHISWGINLTHLTYASAFSWKPAAFGKYVAGDCYDFFLPYASRQFFRWCLFQSRSISFSFSAEITSVFCRAKMRDRTEIVGYAARERVPHSWHFIMGGLISLDTASSFRMIVMRSQNAITSFHGMLGDQCCFSSVIISGYQTRCASPAAI